MSDINYFRKLDNGIYTYPRDIEISPEDLTAMIAESRAGAAEYNLDKDYYLGKHDVLNLPPREAGPDNRLVVNMPYYIVNTFNGYFLGVPPTISLDDDTQNDQLNDWLDVNSFVDELNEVSKLVDIYGRCYIYVYQDEFSETKTATVSPTDCFMVYDDTIQHNPIAFVRYWIDYDGTLQSEVCYKDRICYCDVNGNVYEEHANVYGFVPAVEFYANDDRNSLFKPVKSLCDALDKAMSSKANEVAYFDNAYLKILGLDLTDEDGNINLNLTGNQIIYSDSEDAPNAVVDFLEKPDADTQQEHLIDRLVDMIYQTSMVANLNDEAFSGNSSGVALEYKLLPMKNLAATKERKFTQQLRMLFRIALSAHRIVSNSNEDTYRDIKFTFTRNLPVNIDSEASAAQKLTGITSKETQLGQLSFVKDPKAEMELIDKEQREQVENAVRNNASAVDMFGNNTDDEEVAKDVINDESKGDDA